MVVLATPPFWLAKAITFAGPSFFGVSGCFALELVDSSSGLARGSSWRRPWALTGPDSSSSLPGCLSLLSGLGATVIGPHAAALGRLFEGIGFLKIPIVAAISHLSAVSFP